MKISLVPINVKKVISQDIEVVDEKDEKSSSSDRMPFIFSHKHLSGSLENFK